MLKLLKTESSWDKPKNNCTIKLKISIMIIPIIIITAKIIIKHDNNSWFFMLDVEINCLKTCHVVKQDLYTKSHF